MNKFDDKVAFALGTGRCGTKFLYQILKLEPAVSSVHERNPLNESFHRYCKWYRLPVDDEGFLATKEKEIMEDLESNIFSFEASAHLSLSIEELYQRFGAKFILLTRRPEKMVNSYLRKGWYDQKTVYANPELALGYQECLYFHHFLGRIVPRKDQFWQWQELSRVGKLSWYWNVLNSAVLDQFKYIPTDHWRIFKIEEFSYGQYLELASFIEISPTVSPEKFEAIRTKKPNKQDNVPGTGDWSTTEIEEFESQVKPMAEHFNYQYRVEILAAEEKQKKNDREKGSFKKLLSLFRKNSG